MKANTTQTESNASEKWVAYYRVSTSRQGLGLEAQKAKVEAAAVSAGAEIIAEFSEKESGKDNDRVELSKAIMKANTQKAKVVVAKYDRLSRNLTFASSLVFESGTKFLILDMPAEAMENTLLFGVYFGLASHEAKLISERTKAALAKLKAQGVKLGRPDGKTAITDEMREAAAKAITRKAEENPNNVAASNEIRRYLGEGNKKNYLSIARHLYNLGIKTARGKEHTAQSVKLLCQRYGL